MVSSTAAYLALLGAVAVERLYELRLSRRNARWALGRGGVEVGHRHFRVMAAVHTVFLVACALEVLLLGRAFPGALGHVALGGVVAAQALRYWAVRSLGPRWNVRVIVLPGEPPVVRGPYRFLRHPNYVAVALELLCLPMVHGAVLTAFVFSVLNAALLTVRIRAEEEALGAPYAQRFAGVPRFVPGGRRAE
jgi:methyltransferase